MQDMSSRHHSSFISHYQFNHAALSKIQPVLPTANQSGAWSAWWNSSKSIGHYFNPHNLIVLTTAYTNETIHITEQEIKKGGDTNIIVCLEQPSCCAKHDFQQCKISFSGGVVSGLFWQTWWIQRGQWAWLEILQGAVNNFKMTL